MVWSIQKFATRGFAGAILVCALWAVFAAAAFSAEVIVFDQGNPPFMYLENGQTRGVYPAIIGDAFRRMGVGVTMQCLPWPRALQGADAGSWGVGGLYMTEERLWKYDYSEPIFEEKLMLYVVRGREFPFSGIKDLAGKRIGVMRGWTYGDEFEQAVADGTVIPDPVNTEQANVGRLLLGRVDVIVSAPESLALVRDLMDPRGRVVALPRPLAVNKTYLSFPKSKNLAPLLDRFNAELRRMRFDGALDHLVRENLR